MVTATFDYSTLPAQAAADPTHPHFTIGVNFLPDGTFNASNRKLLADYEKAGEASFFIHWPAYAFTIVVEDRDAQGNYLGSHRENRTQPASDDPRTFSAPYTSPAYDPQAGYILSSDGFLRFHVAGVPPIPQQSAFLHGSYTAIYKDANIVQPDGWIYPPTQWDLSALSFSELAFQQALDRWTDSMPTTSIDLVYSKSGDQGQLTIVGIAPVTFSAPIPLGPILKQNNSPDITEAVIFGTNFADSIGGLYDGPTLFHGTPGNDSFSGGAHADTFDLRGVPHNVEQSVNGGGNLLANGEQGLDLIKLPGSPNEYVTVVTYLPVIGGHQLPFPAIEATETFFIRATDINGDSPGQSFLTRLTEKVSFEQPGYNQVNLLGGHVASEMLDLSLEVYGLGANGLPRADFHKADPLAYNQNPFPLATQAALDRGWHLVEAMELGIPNADYGRVPEQPRLLYSFANGYYQATNNFNESITGDRAEDDALVLTGIVDGKRTLAVSFAGTDQAADALDSFFDFKVHYDRLRPLAQSLKAYADDLNNGIEQVLVSGHSLGAGILQYFMNDIPDTARYQVHAYTAGSPGSDVSGLPADNRIVNFMHTDDPVTKVPLLASTGGKAIASAIVGGIATAANASLLGIAVQPLAAGVEAAILSAHNKVRAGIDISIDTQIGAGLLAFEEHDIGLYTDDVIVLQNQAEELGNLFRGSPLAVSLRTDTAYTGPPVSIALGFDSGIGRSGDDIIIAAATHNYALGAGGNDIIEIQSSQVVTSAPNARQIDGGAGADGLMIFNWDRSQFDLPTVGDVILLTTTGGAPVATLHGIEFVLFPNDETGAKLVGLNGFSIQAQHPLGDETHITYDPSYLFLDARDSDVTDIDVAPGDRAIIIVNNTNVTVHSGSGNDILVADGLSFAPHGRAASLADATDQAAEDERGHDDALPSPAGVAPAQIGVTLSGGAGDDTIVGGPNADTLSGDEGTDALYGGLGGDLLVGGDGGDVLSGGSDNDDLRGQGGNDSISGDDGDDIASGGAGDDLLTGAAGNDTLVGDESDDAAGGNDALFGGDGNDQLFGRGGDDVLIGGDGADLLDGGGGNDTADYSASQVAVFVSLEDHAAGGGDADGDALVSIEQVAGSALGDFFVGDGANNTLSGNAGNDTLAGRGGDDLLIGGDGIDYLTGNLGDDTLYGGADVDALHGQEGSDAIHGDDGDDVGIGAQGADTLYGDAGNDTLIGDDGDDPVGANDTLYGGGGVDQLFGYAGNDQIFGGSDGDLLSGGSGNDTLTGDDGDDALHADAGDDTAYGGAGNDVLVGYDGNDVLGGGEGDDTLIGNAGADTLNGDAGNDQMFGYEDADVINGGLGDDFLAGGGGSDTLHGNDGGDVLDGENDDDQLFGDAGGDNLNGNFGNDTLFGGDGNDGLLGWDGDDVLDGGAGNDFLIGDRADGTGQRGNDTFVFRFFDGNDNIADFQGGQGAGDVIDIHDFASQLADFDAVMARASDVNGGVYIQLRLYVTDDLQLATDAIFLEGVASKNLLAPDDFLI